MEELGSKIVCATCGRATLPGPAEYAGQSIPRLPRIVTCENCATRYKLRKNALAFAQTKNTFWDWMAPNAIIILLTLGLALIVLLPMFWISKLLGRHLAIDIYKKMT